MQIISNPRQFQINERKNKKIRWQSKIIFLLTKIQKQISLTLLCLSDYHLGNPLEGFNR